MLNIQKKLTPYNFTDKNSLARIKYIVIHYVGAVSTAKNNADYFFNGYRGASAHYFVDETSIWQCVLDEDASWHCGGGLQGSQYHSFYQKCTNSNSIGIEMCVKKDANGKWYFEPQTVQNTIDLVQYLMAKYNVPASNVIRHADVTGKQCPEPYCYSSLHDIAWTDFKSKIGNSSTKVVVKDVELVGKVVNLGNSSHLRVRDLPNTTTGKQIGQLALGDIVYINGRCENGWYRADFKNSCGVGYFSNAYIEIIQSEVKHSYDNTVNNLIVDGITTIENMQYWERVFAGETPVNLDYLRTLFDRYHKKI